MHFGSFLFPLTFIALHALANEASPKVKHDYQSDVARLRKIVINSLYSHQEIFLRELISNVCPACVSCVAIELCSCTKLGGLGFGSGNASGVILRIVPFFAV
jgi:hypothetical protein